MRLFSSALGVLYFVTNVMGAHASETNFWAARRQSVARRSPSALLAGFPTLRAATRAAVPDRFPELFPPLPDKIKQTLPPRFFNDQAELLRALPFAEGSVRGISLPPRAPLGGPVVIHIQDVHQNQEAQRHIAAAVAALSARVDVIGLEGSTRVLDLARFRTFPDRNAVAIAAEESLAQNEITGPIHAALTAKEPFPSLVGVDDPLHYAANIEAYRQSAPRVAAEEEKLATLKASLETEKQRVFNSRLLKFDRSVRDYREGRTTLSAYVKSLTAAGPPLSPEVGRFSEALTLEERLDFKAVESDRVRVVGILAARLDENALAQLTFQGTAYRAGTISYGDFYRFLMDLCARHGVMFGKDLDAYVRYVLLADRVDAGSLFDELQAMEADIYKRLTSGPKEADLLARSRQAYLTGKLVDFSLTPMEWADYQAASTPGLESFESFYREAHRRDAAMAGNLLAALSEIKDKKSSPVALLVTGGYHAPGLTRELIRAGVAVISFVPRIDAVDSSLGPIALGVFTQEKTPLQKLFEGEKLFLGQNPLDVQTESLALPAKIAVQGDGNVDSALEALAPRSVLNRIRSTVKKDNKLWLEFPSGTWLVTWNPKAPQGQRFMASLVWTSSGMALGAVLLGWFSPLVGLSNALPPALCFAFAKTFFQAGAMALPLLHLTGSDRPWPSLGTLGGLTVILSGSLFIPGRLSGDQSLAVWLLMSAGGIGYVLSIADATARRTPSFTFDERLASLWDKVKTVWDHLRRILNLRETAVFIAVAAAPAVLFFGLGAFFPALLGKMSPHISLPLFLLSALLTTGSKYYLINRWRPNRVGSPHLPFLPLLGTKILLFAPVGFVALELFRRLPDWGPIPGPVVQTVLNQLLAPFFFDPLGYVVWQTVVLHRRGSEVFGELKSRLLPFLVLNACVWIPINLMGYAFFNNSASTNAFVGAATTVIGIVVGWLMTHGKDHRVLRYLNLDPARLENKPRPIQWIVRFLFWFYGRPWFPVYLASLLALTYGAAGFMVAHSLLSTAVAAWAVGGGIFIGLMSVFFSKRFQRWMGYVPETGPSDSSRGVVRPSDTKGGDAGVKRTDSEVPSKNDRPLLMSALGTRGDPSSASTEQPKEIGGGLPDRGNHFVSENRGPETGQSPLPVEVKAMVAQASKVALTAIQEAGAYLVAEQAAARENGATKPDGSWVSHADIESERMVVNLIRSAFPSHAIVGEEKTAELNGARPFVWYVDPLDGTTNYLGGNPGRENRWGVLIGLLYRGTPVLGYSFFPLVKDAQGNPLLIRARAGDPPGIWVGDTFYPPSEENRLPSNPREAAVMGHGDYRNGNPYPGLAHAVGVFGEVEPHASSISLWLALMALRRVGIQVPGLPANPVIYAREKVNDWDIVAPGIALEAAGAVVSLNNGTRPMFPLSYTAGTESFQRGFVASLTPAYKTLWEREVLKIAKDHPDRAPFNALARAASGALWLVMGMGAGILGLEFFQSGDSLLAGIGALVGLHALSVSLLNLKDAALAALLGLFSRWEGTGQTPLMDAPAIARAQKSLKRAEWGVVREGRPFRGDEKNKLLVVPTGSLSGLAVSGGRWLPWGHLALTEVETGTVYVSDLLFRQMNSGFLRWVQAEVRAAVLDRESHRLSPNPLRRSFIGIDVFLPFRSGKFGLAQKNQFAPNSRRLSLRRVVDFFRSLTRSSRIANNEPKPIIKNRGLNFLKLLSALLLGISVSSPSWATGVNLVAVMNGWASLWAVVEPVVTYGIPIYFAIVLHELGHGWMAFYRGDSTARNEGRLSLNPLSHVDLFGTVLVPAVLSQFGFVFGWAKPVPIDFARLNNPRRDIPWVAAAGPAANAVQFLFWGLTLFLATHGIPAQWSAFSGFLTKMAKLGIQINVALFIFNLIPFPPLDGSRILFPRLPGWAQEMFVRIERVGLVVIILTLFYYGGPLLQLIQTTTGLIVSIALGGILGVSLIPSINNDVRARAEREAERTSRWLQTPMGNAHVLAVDVAWPYAGSLGLASADGALVWVRGMKDPFRSSEFRIAYAEALLARRNRWSAVAGPSGILNKLHVGMVHPVNGLTDRTLPLLIVSSNEMGEVEESLNRLDHLNRSGDNPVHVVLAGKTEAEVARLMELKGGRSFVHVAGSAVAPDDILNPATLLAGIQALPEVAALGSVSWWVALSPGIDVDRKAINALGDKDLAGSLKIGLATLTRFLNGFPLNPTDFNTVLDIVAFVLGNA